MIYDELIEELALTLLIKARYEGCISVIDGYKEWWPSVGEVARRSRDGEVTCSSLFYFCDQAYNVSSPGS